jgi:hypothetical protein
MKMTGEDVGWRVRVLSVACALVFLASQALAQDVTITNPDQLAQVALSANYSVRLPFSPWEWRAYPTDCPLWCDFTETACLDSLPTSTNFMTSVDWSNVPVASVILTKAVLSGVVTLSADGTNVIATIPAPSGYQPGAAPEDRWLWNWYVATTNNPDGWGLTPGQIPPPTVTLRTFLTDSNAYYSVYESNVAAEVAAEAAAAAQASSAPTFAMGGNFGAMDDGGMMDDSDPCVITNESAPFSIVSVTVGGQGCALQWASCTDHIYVVQSEGSLTPTSSWTDVAWMFGTDQQTSWTDTNAVGLTQNFYQVVRGNSTNTNTGIPWWWIVSEGAGDPLDPNLASEDPANDGIDNLEKYDYNLNPQTSYPLQVTINSGDGFSTNQTISISTTGTPAFTFLEVSLFGNMTNAVILTNSASLLRYVLPSNTNGIFRLFFQYADFNTNAVGPVIYHPVILDTIPPFLQVTSPTNGSGHDAYVNLQAVAFDPAPGYPGQPAASHPLQLWVNGQRQWFTMSTTNFGIPRFPVTLGTNVINVLVQDPAGNQTQTNITWVVNSARTNAPQLTFNGFQTNEPTLLPDLQQVYVSGTTSNPFAVVNASVNGGTNTPMTILGNFFGAWLSPLTFGTNTILVTAASASGNTSSNLFLMVNVDDYQLAITSPSPGSYANGQPQVVSGQVSEYWDAGLPTQTNVLSVTVNGQPATLGTPDANSNVTFTTTAAIPVNTNGLPTAYNVVVQWANGVVDPTLGVDEGYVIQSYDALTTVFESQSPCADDWNSSTVSYNTVYCAGNMGLQFTQGNSFDCEGGSSPFASTNCANLDSVYPDCAYPENFVVQYGYEHGASGWPGYTYEGQDFDWGGSIDFMTPSWYQPGTWVVMTFYGCSYCSTNGCDLSQVTWGGLQPVPSSGGSGGSVGYLVEVGPNQTFSVSGSDFGFPGPVCQETNYPDGYPDGGWPPGGWWTSEGNCFTFSGFGNSPAITISGPPNTLVLCQEPSPIVTFNSSVAVGGGDYNWSAGNGLQVVGDNTQPSVNVQGTGNGGVATVSLSYTVNGQTMSATTNCIVRKPTSLVPDPRVPSNQNPNTVYDGSGYFTTTYSYQINDQYGERLTWPGLKASEILLPLSCSTNFNPAAKHDIPAQDGRFQDKLGGQVNVPFREAQTIVVHVEPFDTQPTPGCPVRHNCLISNGSEITASANSDGTGACCR